MCVGGHWKSSECASCGTRLPQHVADKDGEDAELLWCGVVLHDVAVWCGGVEWGEAV